MTRNEKIGNDFLEKKFAKIGQFQNEYLYVKTLKKCFFKFIYFHYFHNKRIKFQFQIIRSCKGIFKKYLNIP